MLCVFDKRRLLQLVHIKLGLLPVLVMNIHSILAVCVIFT